MLNKRSLKQISADILLVIAGYILAMVISTNKPNINNDNNVAEIKLSNVLMRKAKAISYINDLKVREEKLSNLKQEIKQEIAKLPFDLVIDQQCILHNNRFVITDQSDELLRRLQ
jgi:CHAT domain-containing protein